MCLLRMCVVGLSCCRLRDELTCVDKKEDCKPKKTETHNEDYLQCKSRKKIVISELQRDTKEQRDVWIRNIQVYIKAHLMEIRLAVLLIKEHYLKNMSLWFLVSEISCERSNYYCIRILWIVKNWSGRNTQLVCSLLNMIKQVYLDCSSDFS